MDFGEPKAAAHRTALLYWPRAGRQPWGVSTQTSSAFADDCVWGAYPC